MQKIHGRWVRKLEWFHRRQTKNPPRDSCILQWHQAIPGHNPSPKIQHPGPNPLRLPEPQPPLRDPVLSAPHLDRGPVPLPVPISASSSPGSEPSLEILLIRVELLLLPHDFAEYGIHRHSVQSLAAAAIR